MKHIPTFEEFVNESELNEMDAKNKISDSDMKRIEDVIRSIYKSGHFGYDSRIYSQQLHDPIQTHAIYGCDKVNIDKLKDALSASGAKKFRTVKNGNNPILCFDASKMK